MIHDIHYVIFIAEAPEKTWAFATSFIVLLAKLVANARLFWLLPL